MNNITKFSSANMMAVAAADYIVKIASDSIRAHGRFTMALSGGKTPDRLFGILSAESYRDKIDWKKTFVFWGDERCVPADSKDNNSHNAKLSLINNIPIPEENIFPVPVELAPAAAAKKYEQTIKETFKTDHPKFDLILLGMGDNGHTASLFPHTKILHEQKALVKEVHVEELKSDRISFSAPLINAAEHILFLVAGKEKEQMLKLVLEGDYKPEEYPAQLIRNADWFISTM